MKPNIFFLFKRPRLEVSSNFRLQTPLRSQTISFWALVCSLRRKSFFISIYGDMFGHELQNNFNTHDATHIHDQHQIANLLMQIPGFYLDPARSSTQNTFWILFFGKNKIKFFECENFFLHTKKKDTNVTICPGKGYGGLR